MHFEIVPGARDRRRVLAELHARDAKARLAQRDHEISGGAPHLQQLGARREGATEPACFALPQPARQLAEQASLHVRRVILWIVRAQRIGGRTGIEIHQVALSTLHQPEFAGQVVPPVSPICE